MPSYKMVMKVADVMEHKWNNQGFSIVFKSSENDILANMARFRGVFERNFLFIGF